MISRIKPTQYPNKKSLSVLSALIVGLLFTLTGQASEWKPTDPINASKILNEARQDRTERRYGQALQKHIWFHQNALKYNIGMGGVRLSYALSDWLELAKVYPPALDAMKAEAIDAEQRVLAGDISRIDLFHDVVSINQTLNQDEKSVELFKQIAATEPQDAKIMLIFVTPQLIAAKEYELMRRFTDPRESIRMTFLSYDSLNSFMEENGNSAIKKYDSAEEHLKQSAANLVALLSVLGETDLASEIRDSALRKSSSEKLNSALTAAMDGVFPTYSY